MEHQMFLSVAWCLELFCGFFLKYWNVAIMSFEYSQAPRVPGDIFVQIYKLWKFTHVMVHVCDFFSDMLSNCWQFGRILIKM